MSRHSRDRKGVAKRLPWEELSRASVTEVGVISSAQGLSSARGFYPSFRPTEGQQRVRVHVISRSEATRNLKAEISRLRAPRSARNDV